jgi:DNA (cytosine-5)-methyltransferase 1
LRTVQPLAGFSSGDTYDVHWKLLNSADYGVPQKRERVFIVALRRDLDLDWRFPAATHSEDRLLYEQYVTGDYWLRHRIAARIPDSRSRRRADRLRLIPPMELPWQTLRSAVAGLPEPVDGTPNSEWTFHIGIPGARLYAGHTGNDLDKPAKTIKAGDHGNPGGEHVMLKDDGTIRYLTVRECARVQAFPDAYRFSGSRTEAMRQIGNAVPASLAEVLATSIREALDRKTIELPMLRELSAAVGN